MQYLIFMYRKLTLLQLFKDHLFIAFENFVKQQNYIYIILHNLIDPKSRHFKDYYVVYIKNVYYTFIIDEKVIYFVRENE